jgi:hypothetical protein
MTEIAAAIPGLIQLTKPVLEKQMEIEKKNLGLMTVDLKKKMFTV